MEIRTLQYFLAIAREENISAAADFLHITQPTLSRQMKDLEDELGKQLFIRGKRRISLTEAGILLRKRAEEITSLVERTESEIMASEELLTGDIYIGCSESNGMRLIAKAIDKMSLMYPHVKFHLYSGNADEMYHKIEDGILDFAIVIEPVELKKYDYLKLPYMNTWGILMSNRSTLANNEFITPKDLRGKPLLCSNQTMVKNELAGWIGGNQRKLNIVGTYNLLYNASLLVEEGHFYALCLKDIINIEGKDLCFKPLYPQLEAGMLVIWKKYQPFARPAEVFLEILKEEFN
ncbi:MAG: LysR family transcriptional regulator [Coprobacillus cateniformis]|uniref:LysR family transcriptional regulator n=1 Tax=Longibaculum muris TaxID=1796628 RepID=UPI003AB88928|nr:LysR family transcriptional regulator [Coprobacillus cateniformis]